MSSRVERYYELERKTRHFFESFKDRVSESARELILEFIDHCELQLAVIQIIDSMAEREVKVTPDELQRIQDAAEEMDLGLEDRASIRSLDPAL